VHEESKVPPPVSDPDDDDRLPPDEAGRRPLKRTFAATFHTHNELWAAARHYRHLRRQDRSGGWYLDLATMLFAHFAVEAYVNFLGGVIAPDTWAHERERFPSGGAVRKIKHLARLCDARVDKGTRPLRTICELQELRNELAHGRPEQVEGDLGPDEHFDMKSRISKAVSPAAADVALEDAEAVVEHLHAAARAKHPQHGLPPTGFSSISGRGTEVGGRS